MTHDISNQQASFTITLTTGLLHY